MHSPLSLNLSQIDAPKTWKARPRIYLCGPDRKPSGRAMTVAKTQPLQPDTVQIDCERKPDFTADEARQEWLKGTTKILKGARFVERDYTFADGAIGKAADVTVPELHVCRRVVFRTDSAVVTTIVATVAGLSLAALDGPVDEIVRSFRPQSNSKG